MRRSLSDYRGIVDDGLIAKIYKGARNLHDIHVLNINSTYQGGGVSEMLTSLMPLMNDAGVDAGWRVLHGTKDFFNVTKKFHNALQGAKINLSSIKKRLYTDVNENFSVYTHPGNHYVIIHDPQPLAMIKFYKKRHPWVWRCHIDLTEPNQDLWDFLKQFIIKYDVIIVSSERYKKPDLPVEQRIIHPAIDPLSLKNKDLSEKDVAKYAGKAGIPFDKPVITQVSRMDSWKDPEGLLDVFRLVREKVDCRLVYCYNMATDDPEGIKIYSRVYRKAKKLVDSGEVIFVIGNNDILVNAVQRFSTVVVQKSTREGFCLCVTEAMWKGKPVVASNVGGIPSQITDGKNGFLLDSTDIKGFANRIVRVLKNRKLAAELGKKARETVKRRFLITRLLLDYLNLLQEISK